MYVVYFIIVAKTKSTHSFNKKKKYSCVYVYGCLLMCVWEYARVCVYLNEYFSKKTKKTKYISFKCIWIRKILNLNITLKRKTWFNFDGKRLNISKSNKIEYEKKKIRCCYCCSSCCCFFVVVVFRTVLMDFQ